MKIGKIALYGFIALISVLFLFGCPGSTKVPLSIKIDDQLMDEGNTLVLELNDYVSGTNTDSLTFTKLSGVGAIGGSKYSYEADYDASGTYEVVIKVENDDEEAQDSFVITVNDVNRKPELELLSPEDEENDVPVNTKLTWDATDADGDKINYTIYFGKDSNPPVLEEDITKTSYSVNNLDYETTYYWKVDAEDEKGQKTESSIWSFSTIPANTFLLTVTTSPDTGLDISIDGANYTSPKTLSFTQDESVNIGVTTPQEKDNEQKVVGNDTKYTFNQWNDGNLNDVRTITITSDTTYTAEMDREYKVETGTNPSGLVEIDGSGWYDDGTTHSFTAPEVTGYTFHHWEVNDENVGTDNPIDITINSPLKIMAVYGTQEYSLTVTTSPDTGLDISIDGANYTSPKTLSFTQDESVNIGVTTPQEKDKNNNVSGTDTKYTFQQWNDGNKNASRNVVMDSDKTFTASMNKEYKVETGTNPEGIATINGAGWYDAGDSHDFTAPDVLGYSFDHWEINGSNEGTDNPINVTIDSPKKIVAVYNTGDYAVTVTTTPDTGLDISFDGNPYTSPKTIYFNENDNVDIGVSSPQEKDNETNVTGTDTRYTLNQWNDGNINAVRTVTITADVTYTAQMDVEYKVETGTTPEGVTTITGAGWYTDGSNHDFTAPVVTGYTFDHWEINGAGEGSDNPINVTIDSPKKVIAVYTPEEYTLTINATNGTVNKDPDQTTYTYGTEVQLTADPNEGYQFDRWEGDLTGTTNPDTITMDSDKEVSAYFEVKTYTLTINTTGNGTVTKSPDKVIYDHGDSVEIEAVPNAGWQFDHWEGNLTGSTNPENLTMNADKEITAVFTEETYTLTVNTIGNGNVSKDPDKTEYSYGETVELTATADEFWQFDHWEGDLTGSTNPDNITMVADKVVTAVFTEISSAALFIVDETLNANSEVDIYIRAKNINDVKGFQINIEYDPAYFTSYNGCELLNQVSGFMEIVADSEGLIEIAGASGESVDIVDENIIKITFQTGSKTGNTQITFATGTEVRDSNTDLITVNIADKGNYLIQ